MGINPGNPNFNPSPFPQGGNSSSGASLQPNALPNVSGGNLSGQVVSAGAETVVNTLAQVLMQQTGQLSGALSGTLSGTELQTVTMRLLGLPDEFLQTLALLAQLGRLGEGKSPSAMMNQLQHQQLQEILAQLGEGLLSNVSAHDLTTGLQKQIQKALQQLLPLMTSVPQSVDASSQALKGFQESLQFLIEFSAQLNQSPTQALQTLMALYLPIHPHMAAESFQAYFGKGEQDSELPSSSDETTQLNLIIQTQDAGMIHAVVWLDVLEESTKENPLDSDSGSGHSERQEKHLCLLLRHEENALEKLPVWEKGIKDLCKQSNLPPVLLRWRLMKQLDNISSRAETTGGSDNASVGSKKSTGLSSVDEGSKEIKKEAVTVYPAGGVSVAVLSAGFFVVRVVLSA